MSALGQEWKIRHQRSHDESLWTALLKARELEDPGSFFASASLDDLHDPFLFKDMQSAVDRIQSAIEQKQRIVVYGDYDVDGTSGAAILIQTLKWLGAQVSYRIPHRKNDGYGLHNKYIDQMKSSDVKLYITVDCGISCAEQVAYGNQFGIDAIITDHHAIPKKLPAAHALLHPHLESDYPWKDLAGSGVAFKLASALLIANDQSDKIQQLIDLASLGTVADCVPLLGENRTIVKLGLKQLEHTQWEGLEAIMHHAGVSDSAPYESDVIGFQIGPRINASGRIDDPLWSLQTLIAEGASAFDKALQLEMLNHQRREQTKAALSEAEAQLNTENPLIILKGPWSSGIVGLIAGRLTERYGKPAFIIEEREDKLVGSVRSVEGFHAVNALNEVADLLSNYGGHEQAAGFSMPLDSMEEFETRLQAYTKAYTEGRPFRRILNIDCQLTEADLSPSELKRIQQFAPFGVGNDKPLFLLDSVQVLSSKRVGSQQEHLKFSVQVGDTNLEGIAFRMGEHQAALESATQLVGALELNSWKGEARLQLVLSDFS